MSKFKYNRRLRDSAASLLGYAEGMLDPKRSSFAPFDKEKDAEVRAAIRLYVESWILPPARRLYEELSEKKPTK